MIIANETQKKEKLIGKFQMHCEAAKFTGIRVAFAAQKPKLTTKITQSLWM